MIGAAGDRRDLQSYDPESFSQSDDPSEMMGCHVGGFAGLNISNPQPGFFYAWADDSRHGRLRARLEGYHIVGSDSPEMAAYKTMAEHDGQDLDSANTGFPGLVLVRRSAKDEKRVRAEEQSRRDDLLRSGDSERAYLNKASAEEIRHGGERFKRPEHRSFATAGESEDSQVISSWNADQGISS